MKFKVVSTAAALAMLMATAACGGDDGSSSELAQGDWENVVAAAEKEGSVMLYSSQDPRGSEQLKEAFEKEYPKITMEFVRGVESELIPKAEAEKQTGRGVADVLVLTSPSFLGNAIQDGYTTELVGPDFDAEIYNRDANVIDDSLFVAGAVVFGIAWNTEEYPDGITDMPDLLDPRLKGKIGLPNPQSAATYVDFYETLEANYGTEFFEKLAAMEPKIYPSSQSMVEALNSGEIAATPVSSSVEDAQAAGAPVEFVLPSKLWGSRWYGMVLESSPHPNAAQVLANFMTTEEAQTVNNRNYASSYPGIDGALADASQFPEADFDKYTPEYVADYQARWEGLFL